VSLRLRLLAAFAYVLVLVLVALEIPLALSLSNRVDAEVRAQASTQAQLVAAAAAGRADDRAALRRLVGGAAQDLGARVIVVDAQGRVVADSARGGTASYASRPEIRQALAGTPAQGTRHSETLGEELLFTAVPMVDDGRTVGAVRVTQSVEAVGERVRRNVLVLVAVGLIALALGLALAWVLAGSLSRPLRALAETARRVERGELDARADVTGATEQRDVAVAFNDMTERLGQALAAQREFVANASHQLRTPLTGLRLRIEAAGLRAGDPALERELRAAESEVERLTRLLNALLLLAREGDRPELREPASLTRACETAYERWLPRAEQTGHELELERGPDEVLVRARSEDVAIVLDNLIENALHSAPAGTRVTVSWDGDGRLAVLDEGAGLAPGEEQLVFERFGRGRTDLPGTGLGLAIVETLARRWGGSASLANRPGGGARAEVALPVAELARVGAAT
jgi:two-component system, OmpR family, sensor kinase